MICETFSKPHAGTESNIIGWSSGKAETCGYGVLKKLQATDAADKLTSGNGLHQSFQLAGRLVQQAFFLVANIEG